MIKTALSDYITISDKFEVTNKKISAYLESTMRELAINKQEVELKVLVESGTDDDYTYLCEEAEEGALQAIKKTIKKIIDAFKQFCSDLKSKVVRIICNAETGIVIKKAEAKVKLNPFLAKKKCEITDKKKPLKVIAQYKSAADKQIAKVKAGVFKEHEIQSITTLKENYGREYKAAIMGTAAVATISVVKLIAEIKAEYGQLPNHIDRIDKETSDLCEKACANLQPSAAAALRGAYASIATFRTKLAKDEANEHVDAIMNKLGALKTAVIKPSPDTVKKPIKDIKESYDSDIDGLFDGFMESGELLFEDDDFDAGSLTEESVDGLLDDLFR